MFELIYKKYFKKGTLDIFVFSFMIFIVLNVIENVIHYNIGKYHDQTTSDRGVASIHFTNPSNTDWVRIIMIMFIFAILQGVFTSYFSVC